jgi:hypothetical protein
VSGLAPNEAYTFASAAYTQSGEIIGTISTSTAPIVAATPLPLPLVWANLAVVAARCGEMAVARRAAGRVAALWVSFGPLRPPFNRSPFGALSLRQAEVRVVRGLVVVCRGRWCASEWKCVL